MIDKLSGHFADGIIILMISLVDISMVWKLVSAGIITISVVIAKYWDIKNKKLDNKIKELEIKNLESNDKS